MLPSAHIMQSKQEAVHELLWSFHTEQPASFCLVNNSRPIQAKGVENTQQQLNIESADNGLDIRQVEEAL